VIFSLSVIISTTAITLEVINISFYCDCILFIYLLDHSFEIVFGNILSSFPIFVHIAFLDDIRIIYNMTQLLPHILIFV